MQNFFRYGIAVLIGGLIVGAVLIAGGVSAQDPEADVEAAVAVSLENVQLDGQFLQYQGQLLDPNTGAPVANGSYQMVFRLYNLASGGNPLWQESKLVVVTDGLFATLLGDATPLTLGDFNGQRLWIGADINGNGEALPRMPIAANAYAFYAENAELLNGRTSDSFADTRRQPIAYGVVSKDGGRIKGWNFSGKGHNNGLFWIAINDVHYDVNEYITVVTPVVNPDCENAVLVATGSKDGYLVVDLENPSDGNDIQCKFHFVTFTP